MTKLIFVRIAAALLLGAASFSAVAQLQRAFVASFGNDANPCNLASPCRGFTRALAQTDPNGEVIVLDSGGYGAVTITQAVSIIAPEGVYAGISVFPGQAGVEVNPGVGGKVVLRGLSLNGQGGGPGIRVFSGDEIHIERCTISNMTGQGIFVSGGTATYISDSVVRSNSNNGITMLGGAPHVFVNDTRVADNFQNGIVHQSGTLTLDRVRSQNNGILGLAVNPDVTSTRTLVRDSQFSRNLHGILVTSETGDVADVTVERSAAFNNIFDGFRAQTSGTGVAVLTVSGSVVTRNSNLGISADGGGATVYVSGSTVTQNGIGFSQTNTASFNSLGNNVRRANGTETSGVITPLGLQ